MAPFETRRSAFSSGSLAPSGPCSLPSVSAREAGSLPVKTPSAATAAWATRERICSQALATTLQTLAVVLEPPAPVAGGSNTTASVCNVVAKACEQIRSRVAQAAVAAEGVFTGKDPASLALTDGKLQGPDGANEPLENALRRVSNGAIEAYAENIPHGGLVKLYQGHGVLAGGAKFKDRIQFAFGAEFVEVRVHALTREIRVPRVVGAFAAGQIVDPVTAKSQLMGGLIWGVSSALHEATEIDRGRARYTNTDLAEYLIPVNADIDRAEVILIPEEDRQVNELGIKGLGELGNVGTNAAVANAVYHATGVRVRELPIRLEKLLDAPAIAL